MSAPQPEDDRGTVVPFRRRGRPPAGTAGPKQPVKGLEQYSGDAEPDDYPQRMRNNLLAVVLCVLLVGAGIWLATTIADLRKKQDCVLSGRRDCAELSVPGAGPK